MHKNIGLLLSNDKLDVFHTFFNDGKEIELGRAVLHGVLQVLDPLGENVKEREQE